MNFILFKIIKISLQEVRNFIYHVLTQPLPSLNNNDFTHKRERKNNKSNPMLATTSIKVMVIYI